MDEDVTWYGSIHLGPGHTVLDGDPALPEGHSNLPSFRPMSIVAMVAHLSYCSALVMIFLAISCPKDTQFDI